MPFRTDFDTGLQGGLYILQIKNGRLLWIWNFTQSCVTINIGPGVQSQACMAPKLINSMASAEWPIFKGTSSNILQLS